jgi:hypothetical protein
MESEAELLNDLMLYAHATGVPLDVALPEIEAGAPIAEPRLSPARESVPFD